jgi:hypothetical protein
MSSARLRQFDDGDEPSGAEDPAGAGAQPFSAEPYRPGESFIGLATPVVILLDAGSPDAVRQRMLADTDQLLTDIEELRLDEGNSVSALLRNRIAAAEAEISGTWDSARISSLRRAHEFVLGLQGPLMAANPRNPRSTPARPIYGHIELEIAVQSPLTAPSH